MKSVIFLCVSSPLLLPLLLLLLSWRAAPRLLPLLLLLPVPLTLRLRLVPLVLQTRGTTKGYDDAG